MHRIIHPNRWFFWTIAVLLAGGLGLLVLVYRATVEFEQQAAHFAAENDNLWRIYNSRTLGFSLRYPAWWQVEVDPEIYNAVNFENPKNYSENISVYRVDPKYERVIRDALEIAEETDIVLGGYSGKKLVNKNQKDTAASNVILVKVGGYLYHIAGQAREFDRIVRSIDLTPHPSPLPQGEREKEGYE